MRRNLAAFAAVLFLAAAVHAEPGAEKLPPAADKKSPAKKVEKQDAPPGNAEAVEVVSVIAKHLEMTVRLYGEIQPYHSVILHPKIPGFLEWIGVDRGTRVKKGDVLARLVAPELIAQREEAEAKLRADEIAYQRLKAASETPGVVALKDLDLAEKAVEASEAHVRSIAKKEEYLTISAPFDGFIVERNAHPGTLMGPMSAAGEKPMLRLEQIFRLRLIIPVPETYVEGIAEGAPVKFTVQAYPGETFKGTIARIAHSMDVSTRTMPVELDVDNPDRRLSPGMFPEIEWHVRRSKATAFVPTKAVVTTTEQTFVIRVRDNLTQWVRIRRGETIGGLVEVFGDIKAGDVVVVGASDELRPGTRVSVKSPPPAKP